MRRALIAAVMILAIAGFNWSVWRQEALRAGGAVMLLELEPVDPRAPFLGDYMVLSYRLDASIRNDLFPKSWNADSTSLPKGGTVAVRLDGNRVARTVRLDGGSSLAGDELRLRFVRRGRLAKLAVARAFFFQEGLARDYSRARYGEFRVGEDGRSLLLGLLDGDLHRIVPEKPAGDEEPP
ncbi:MAG: GDYXXLXY domain-containing protein [Planctomycetota bacterium]|jgi:uncharacterized membrane-anchored protein|nr:GDYXXLXY domain-containing protein [Planctomycetota bacterium]